MSISYPMTWLYSLQYHHHRLVFSNIYFAKDVLNKQTDKRIGMTVNYIVSSQIQNIEVDQARISQKSPCERLNMGLMWKFSS
jgi:hypothetical protein